MDNKTLRKLLGGRWKIECYRSGHVVIRRRDQPQPPGVITFYSTSTKTDAEGLQIWTCKLDRITGSDYRLNPIIRDDKDLLDESDIVRLTTYFKEQHDRRLERVAANRRRLGLRSKR